MDGEHGSGKWTLVAIFAAGLTACSGTQGNGERNPSGGGASGVASGGASASGAPGASGAPVVGSGAASGGAIGAGGAKVQPPGAGGAPPSGSGGGVSTGGAGAGPGGSGGSAPDTGGSSGAAGGGSGTAGAAGAAGASGGTLPPVDKVDADGPFAVTFDMNAGPNMGWVAHPTELGRGGVKHPIFTWGCGGGSQPSQYKDHLQRIASHGFVVEAHVSTGDAKDHKVAVDWLIAENARADSPFYQKLDVTKIAAGGHSMGSISTFAFEGMDTRLTTTIHVAGGSFDGNGFMSLKTPVLMVDGSGDTLALSNTQRDYDATTVPVFLTVIQGSDHIYAARDGLPPIVAWLRWQLAGETQRKSMFVGPNCDFCGGKWQGKSKNW